MSRFLPFLTEFHDPIREGRKTVTSRTKMYGQPGSVVDSSVGPLRLLDVTRMQLGWVATHLWREEGCTSPEHFKEVWRRLHARGGKGWVPYRVVYVHRFQVDK